MMTPTCDTNDSKLNKAFWIRLGANPMKEI